jgi:hypothetical protein
MGDSASRKSEAFGKPDGLEASVICLFVVAKVSSRQPPVRERLMVLSSKIAATSRQGRVSARDAACTWLRGFRRTTTL